MAASGDLETTDKGLNRLRIVHVMRAPVGGLFRHVADLARAQAQAGNAVGIIADSSTGGEAAENAFASLAPFLTLGLTRLPMQRLPHPSDLQVAWRIARRLQELDPDIAHGHGAKGGLFVRLPALVPGFPRSRRGMARIYTPHGGTLHYSPKTLGGRLFLAAEQRMTRVTDLIPFESDFARRRFLENVGAADQTIVVPNGIAEAEFTPVTPAPDAADFLFVGELRKSKGVETLIDAFAALGGDLRLVLIGAGPDEAAFRERVEALKIAERVTFAPPMYIRDALGMGRVLVMPSHAESMPYIVLECIAAKVPIIATNVGGVPEIFGPQISRLTPPGDVAALSKAMREMREMPAEARDALGAELAAFVRERFTLKQMVSGILRGYRDALRAEPLKVGPTPAPLRTGD